MILYGLPILFVVLLLKEVGVPLPVPTDLIMLGAAARAATGQESAVAVILLLDTALLLGGTAQYFLVRGPGQRLLHRVGPTLGLTPSRLDRAAHTVQKGGSLAVGIGMMTPGVRALTIAASGFANLQFARFFVGLVVGDTVFVLLHVALGYAAGAGLMALAQAQHRAVGPLLIAIASGLLVVGLAGWALLHRRTARRHRAGMAATVQAWEEASCPLCLTLAALRSERENGTAGV